MRGVGVNALTEAALLREVARVQHDKTLQAVRDLVDSIKVETPDGRYDTKKRTAAQFRTDLIAGLQQIREGV